MTQCCQLAKSTIDATKKNIHPNQAKMPIWNSLTTCSRSLTADPSGNAQYSTFKHTSIMQSFEYTEDSSGINKAGSPNRTRTCDNSVNSRALYQLSYRGILRTRTPATNTLKRATLTFGLCASNIAHRKTLTCARIKYTHNTRIYKNKK